MHRIKHMKETLINWLEAEIGKGRECFDVDAAGKVSDIIKDLAESEEKCIKAAYYSTIMDAMEGAEEHARRYGYDNWRYSSGRFAPKGSGHYEGYTPFRGNVRVHNPNITSDFKMGYEDAYPTMPNMDHEMYSDKGRYYDEYKMAKKHYTESRRPDDLTEMNKKMSENISNVISQLREMYGDASPEMRKRLKIEISEIMDDLSKSM